MILDDYSLFYGVGGTQPAGLLEITPRLNVQTGQHIEARNANGRLIVSGTVTGKSIVGLIVQEIVRGIVARDVDAYLEQRRKSRNSFTSPTRTKHKKGKR